MLTAMSTQTPDQIRTQLVECVEHRYYSGETAGQMWLHDLSTYLQALPTSDARLRQLAEGYGAATAADYVLVDSRPIVSRLNPSLWLDSFVHWAVPEGQTAPPPAE
jgi:hypothetical protein